MSGLKVVPFSGGNVTDIPAGLRNLADLIESGAQEGAISGLTDVKALVWITLDVFGDTDAGALGPNVDKHRAAGIALAAINKLTGAAQ